MAMTEYSTSPRAPPLEPIIRIFCVISRTLVEGSYRSSEMLSAYSIDTADREGSNSQFITHTHTHTYTHTCIYIYIYMYI